MLRLVANRAAGINNTVLGGHNRVIEIDKSLFVKVKHLKGKDLVPKQVWIFGMYERPLDVLFVEVPSRDARTLLNVI